MTPQNDEEVISRWGAILCVGVGVGLVSAHQAAALGWALVGAGVMLLLRRLST